MFRQHKFMDESDICIYCNKTAMSLWALDQNECQGPYEETNTYKETQQPTIFIEKRRLLK